MNKPGQSNMTAAAVLVAAAFILPRLFDFDARLTFPMLAIAAVAFVVGWRQSSKADPPKAPTD